MTSIKIWTGVCAALLLAATLVSGTAMAQEPKVQDPKVQNAKMVEGLLLGIDQNAKVLTLKAGDNELQFSYTEQTELVAPETDGKPAVVRQGTRIRAPERHTSASLVRGGEQMVLAFGGVASQEAALRFVGVKCKQPWGRESDGSRAVRRGMRLSVTTRKRRLQA
jgi:hypothetical protein